MTYGDFDRASRICVFSVQDCPYRLNDKCVLAPYMLAKGEDEKETQFCYLRFVPEWRFNRLPSKKSVKVELQDSEEPLIQIKEVAVFEQEPVLAHRGPEWKRGEVAK